MYNRMVLFFAISAVFDDIADISRLKTTKNISKISTLHYFSRVPCHAVRDRAVRIFGLTMVSMVTNYPIVMDIITKALEILYRVISITIGLLVTILTPKIRHSTEHTCEQHAVFTVFKKTTHNLI